MGNPHAKRPQNNPHAESNNRALSIPAFVNVEYKVGKQLGEGSFGIIFEGVNLFSHLQVAIKFESSKSDAPQLRDEFRAYRILSGCEGVPQSYYFGQDGLHNMLIIDRLGNSLETWFNRCGRTFSIKTVCMLAKSMITRIKTVHEKSLVYRDIKPDNFLTGREDSETEHMIWIVDFGMSKFYRDPRTKQHNPFREKKSLSGTARYMSINTHLGREQSRRDDLEALGYVFFYFLRGSLPWQNLKARTNRQKYEMIGETKQNTSIEKLSEKCPSEFAEYLNYVKRLEFEEEPDYKYLISLMDSCLLSHNLVDDNMYDWRLIEKNINNIEHQSSVLSPNRNSTAINNFMSPRQLGGIPLTNELHPLVKNLQRNSNQRISYLNNNNGKPNNHQNNDKANNISPLALTAVPEVPQFVSNRKKKSKNFFCCCGR